ncbi:MAG: TatD family hydrolase [Saccharospirillaceae bacterium]|nr:TatD family hydrolase [Saccharospirillaceae bacterium]MCD8530426.1 TatD family hydrolase [Saccharospirillaceae bacterium]
MSPLAPRWFDSHCHFDFAALDHEREQQWALAQRSGVSGLLIPGVHRQQGEQLAAFCQNQPFYYALGLHPYFLSEHNGDDLCWLAQALQQPDVIALGEAGLDWVLAATSEQRQQQWFWFRAQVALATTYQLPMILHIRGAHDEAASFLRQQQFRYGGMVHAFSGSEQQGKVWRKLGFRLGIGGAMSHPRAQKLRRTVAALPLDCWLLETDSPDMQPAFWRGANNSPASIPLLAAMLASLHNVSLAELAACLEHNLQQTFPRISARSEPDTAE